MISSGTGVILIMDGSLGFIANSLNDHMKNLLP